MPNTLAAKSCTPCRGGIPPLTIEEAQVYLAQAPDWDLLDDGQKIQRTYRFKNFREALGFVAAGGRARRGRGPSSRHRLWLGLRHRLAADQEDQRFARERLHHGGEARRSVVALTQS